MKRQAKMEDVVDDWEQEMGQEGVEDTDGNATANRGHGGPEGL
jgi:hypothetical protein